MLKWYLLKHPCCLALRILLPWYNINLQLSSANRKPPFPIPLPPPIYNGSYAVLVSPTHEYHSAITVFASTQTPAYPAAP